MAFENILSVVFLTIIPVFELRGSIPYGINVLGLDWPTVFVVAVATNAVLGPVIYFILNRFVHLFLRFAWIDGLYQRLVIRTRHRVERYVDRWGLLGIVLFVGIPLPGSGSYTGALAAHILGLDHKKFALANLVGVILAGTVMTLFSLGLLVWINGF